MIGDLQTSDLQTARRRDWYSLEITYWGKLSLNSGLKYQEICEHYASCTAEERTRYKWRWRTMCCRRDVSVEMLLSAKNVACTNLVWSSKYASSNPNLTTDIVLKYPDNWEWSILRWNESLVLTDELISHPLYVFNGGVSHTRSLTLQFVLDHENAETQELNWEYLSMNPSISIEMILAHPEPQCAWEWDSVSDNPNLTVQHLRQSKSILPDGKQWDKDYISANINLPADFIIDSKDAADENQRFLSCDYLSSNPNLTAQLVAKHIEDINLPWNWGNLCSNRFAFEKNSLAEKEVQYHKVMDAAVWSALNLSNDNSNNSSSSNYNAGAGRRRLPTALAQLTLQYFSPWY